MNIFKILFLSSFILQTPSALAKAPSQSQAKQIKAVTMGTLGADPNNAKHEAAMGFANKEIKWGVLRSLTKGKDGKALVKDQKLKAILNKEIQLKGYMLPLDFSKKEVKEFLLLPYIPSCMHIPPPPSTQIIHVKMGKGAKAKQTYMPVEVKGIIKVLENKEYESSYILTAKLVNEFDPAKEDKKKGKKK